jgi:hypothetical protein
MLNGVVDSNQVRVSGERMTNRGRNGLLRQSTLIPSDSPSSSAGKGLKGSAGLELVKYCAQETALDFFPNDLTRMLYLASLRDCNSGLYLHPHLSNALSPEAVDRGLRTCHEQVFQRLLTTSIRGYAAQLEEYVRYTRTELCTVLRTWQSLGAYRATVPLCALPIYSELFSLNVELAMTILQSRQV